MSKAIIANAQNATDALRVFDIRNDEYQGAITNAQNAIAPIIELCHRYLTEWIIMQERRAYTKMKMPPDHNHIVYRVKATHYDPRFSPFTYGHAREVALKMMEQQDTPIKSILVTASYHSGQRSYILNLYFA